ncbi:MAG: DUF485 domain-containing protein [Zoogloeaceae bacterium]|nr:DUF485 domain-containing protein [Zoogloeaceae bacterium]
MNETLNEKILAHPQYRQLVKTRTSYAVRLSILMLLVWFGYIALSLFSLGAGIFLLAGAGVIVCALLLTRVYARRADREFDGVMDDMVKELKRAAD